MSTFISLLRLSRTEPNAISYRGKDFMLESIDILKGVRIAYSTDVDPADCSLY